MPVYIIVQCFRCHTYQCCQHAQTNKFTCVICHEKQTVQKVLSRSEKPKDLTPIVQEYNMNRTDAELNWIKKDTTTQQSTAAERFQHQQQRYRAAIEEKILKHRVFGDDNHSFTSNTNTNPNPNTHKNAATAAVGGRWSQFIENKHTPHSLMPSSSIPPANLSNNNIHYQTNALSFESLSPYQTSDNNNNNNGTNIQNNNVAPPNSSYHYHSHSHRFNKSHHENHMDLETDHTARFRDRNYSNHSSDPLPSVPTANRSSHPPTDNIAHIQDSIHNGLNTKVSLPPTCTDIKKPRTQSLFAKASSLEKLPFATTTTSKTTDFHTANDQSAIPISTQLVSIPNCAIPRRIQPHHVTNQLNHQPPRELHTSSELPPTSTIPNKTSSTPLHHTILTTNTNNFNQNSHRHDNDNSNFNFHNNVPNIPTSLPITTPGAITQTNQHPQSLSFNAIMTQPNHTESIQNNAITTPLSPLSTITSAFPINPSENSSTNPVASYRSKKPSKWDAFR